REELTRGEIDRLVGRLRRQHHGHEELERRAVLELGGGVRVRPGEALEDLAALLRVHLRLRERMSARMRLRSSAVLAGIAFPAFNLLFLETARLAAARFRASLQRPRGATMSMQSTGQAGGQSAQPMHQGSTTVCISPCAPTIASTG